jgi:hypothetical protein
MVARGGDLTNTVLRENVSVPEIGVLIGIHGIDGISRVPGTTSECAVKHVEEYDRIQNIYGNDATVRILGQRGFNISLPTRLASVFADVVDEPEEEESPKPKRGGIKLSAKAEESDELLTD